MVFFFFQAEDGIRDLVRSRGLGDVYKRQVWLPAENSGSDQVQITPVKKVLMDGYQPRGGKYTVSYTHLTLPTSDLV